MNRCIFSSDRVYRYVLRFQCATAALKFPQRVAWIGLNPSTADELTLDQTLAAVCRYSRKWGFSEVVMLNLFAFRTTQPRELKRAVDPIGPDNDTHLLTEVSAADRVIACWGDHGRFRGRDQDVVDLLVAKAAVFECLLKNKSGAPHHPLYLKLGIRPQRFEFVQKRNWASSPNPRMQKAIVAAKP